nr:unnamed protein product [Callosobruchus chinensis]
MTSCHYMGRALLRRHCIYQVKRVLQLLNLAHQHLQVLAAPNDYFLDLIFHWL